MSIDMKPLQMAPLSEDGSHGQVTQSLSGDWTISPLDSDRVAAFTGAVPGDVHTALTAAGEIEDPYYRDRELELQWIGETTWRYSRSFTAGKDLLSRDRVLLRCHGLDTLATITLNGQEIARTDNMFRTWEFDVKALLKSGKNTIEIDFAPAATYVQEKTAEHRLPQWHQPGSLLGAPWMRKEPCNFGWDWGPCLITAGIWREIELVGYSTGRITDVLVQQDHSAAPKSVGLSVQIQTERLGKQGLQVRAQLSGPDGSVIGTAPTAFTGTACELSATVKNPALWFPVDLGEQPLYTLTISLHDADGECLDRWQRAIGLRELRLDRHPDEWGESFQFIANGKPFFAKGANWIPLDAMLGRRTPADYDRLVGDTAWAHMNMLRVWGGGIYEDDAFYDACDRLGVVVWQDFMFACSTYPTFDESFLTSVRHEAVDNVRRLRHHPSIAFWCGNNELEQGLVSGDEWTDRSMPWSEYNKLFEDLLPAVVAAEDPQRDYWPGSPHTPSDDRDERMNHADPTRGDAHLWAVWHGQQPFEWYRTCEHRFNSEFGFQSFPEPRTVATYTEPEDRNVTAFIMEHHQRSQIGNPTIMRYMLDWFRLPLGFENTLWLSQIQQGMAMKYACEHWRRSMPRGMGTLYWQLNDCWPVASWASIDSLGRYKALHYMARHFFAPVLISLLEDPDAGTIEIHLTNDHRHRVDGELHWYVTTAAGEQLDCGMKSVRLGALQNRRAQTLRLSKALADHTARDLIVWAELHVDGELVSENLATFGRPKHLQLAADPAIKTTVRKAGADSFAVQLESRAPAMWAWLTMGDRDATYSDNFLHLRPGSPRVITVTPATPMKVADFKAALQVQSLADTW